VAHLRAGVVSHQVRSERLVCVRERASESGSERARERASEREREKVVPRGTSWGRSNSPSSAKRASCPRSPGTSPARQQVTNTAPHTPLETHFSNNPETCEDYNTYRAHPSLFPKAQGPSRTCNERKEEEERREGTSLVLPPSLRGVASCDDAAANTCESSQVTSLIYRCTHLIRCPDQRGRR